MLVPESYPTFAQPKLACSVADHLISPAASGSGGHHLVYYEWNSNWNIALERAWLNDGADFFNFIILFSAVLGHDSAEEEPINETKT